MVYEKHIFQHRGITLGTELLLADVPRPADNTFVMDRLSLSFRSSSTWIRMMFAFTWFSMSVAMSPVPAGK